MEKYVTGGEETTIKTMEKIRKEIEKNICKKMEGMMEQIEQIRREWKEKKLAREERRKDKEEWIEEKKDREKRRNNIVIKGVNKWGEINVGQVRDFIKENLKIEVEIGKVFKLHAKGGGCTVVAEVGSREQKREVMVRKRELKKGIYIDDDLTKMERERQNHLRDKAKEERKRK